MNFTKKRQELDNKRYYVERRGHTYEIRGVTKENVDEGTFLTDYHATREEALTHFVKSISKINSDLNHILDKVSLDVSLPLGKIHRDTITNHLHKCLISMRKVTDNDNYSESSRLFYREQKLIIKEVVEVIKRKELIYLNARELDKYRKFHTLNLGVKIK